MLSRASSDAGTRLRHAKSTSSTHSRGKSAAARHAEPFVVREHATVAAVQAFERAYALDRTRPRPEQGLEIARHRSNASRASPGSHFPARGSSLRQAGEESAAKRRQSTQSQRFSLDAQQHSKPNAAAALAATPPHPKFESIPTSAVSAPPIPKGMAADASPAVSATTPAQKHVRKSRSMYTSWSLGIGSPHDPHQSPPMDVRCPSNQRAKENRVPVAPVREDDTIPQGYPVASASEAIAAARDKVLQDFQKNRLMTRPSFVFTPFKKRPDRQQQHQPSTASEDSPSHATPPHSVPAPAAAPAKLEEKRSLSGSLRSKFKRVFRKTSKPSISLPIQQVDASRVYFGNSIQTTPGEASPRTASVTPVDYFAARDTPKQTLRQRTSSDNSNRSRKSGDDHDLTDISKSRVTSWTNSSATASLNSHDPKRLSIIPEMEPPSQKKRNTTSLLGRVPFRKAPNTSPHDVVKGPDAFDIFSALKSRLEKAGLDSNLDPDLLKSGNQSVHEQTERATLPSQIRNTSGTSSKVSRATKATIRSVTPDVFGKSRSKERVGDGHQQFNDQDDMDRDSPDDDDSGLVIPRIRLQRTAKATIPTPEQISRRKRKTDSRWQTQLHQGHSPVFSKNLKKAMAGTNPYELTRLDSSPSPSKSVEAPPRTSSRKPQQPVDMLNPGWPSRADIMSPSVYSRDSTGESPLRKESGGSNCPPGTVVIVSSHSAKSYTLGSSPKKDAPPGTVRSSKDWKKWLSKEVSELDLSQDFDMSMTEEWLLKPAGHQREHAEIVGVPDGDDEVVIFKARPASHNFPNTRPERLTLIEPKEGAVGASDLPGPGEVESGNCATDVRTEVLVGECEGQNRLRGVKSSIRKVETPVDNDVGAEQVKLKSGNNPNTLESGRNTDHGSESASPSEPEEKIPVSTLADKRIRNSQSLQSVHRSAGRSHSSLAHYTTSAEDPVMQQQRPTVVPTYSTAETASAANPPSLRYRPAPNSAAAPFYRPRSAFDLRQHRSGDQLRSAPYLHGGSPAAAVAPSPTGPTLLPPPPHHPHTHHLRRKPMAVGGCRGRGRLTPSPTPNPASLEGDDTMHSIMQGPYGRANPETASTNSSTPPWVPPPPPASLGPSFARQHWNRGSPSPMVSRGSPSPLASPAGGGSHGLLTTRQSTPALRVTPKLSSMRLGGHQQHQHGHHQHGGFKENRSPAVTPTPVQVKDFGAEDGGERETPSPGQLLAERWLSARQQRPAGMPAPSPEAGARINDARGGGIGGVSGSMAFL